MKNLSFYILAVIVLSFIDVRAAGEAIFGLESVKIERVFDPNARP